MHQRILRIQSDDVATLETLDIEAEEAAAAAAAAHEEEEEEEEEEEAEEEEWGQEIQTSTENETTEKGQRREQLTPSTSNLIWLRDVQDSVLEQLSKLKEIESLDLSGGFTTYRFLVEHPRGIPWALDAGLDRLKELSKMKELVVTGWEDKMARQEVKWMKHHWPQLRSITNKSGNLTAGVLKNGVLGSSSSNDHNRGIRWSSAVAGEIPAEELLTGVLAMLRNRTILGFEDEVELRMDAAEARS
ncbi:hypothetical protein EC968_009652 [Mortierella alpina]|nr:hypothetical protein EC968_009652 [Mortierella alpina]